MKRASIIFFTGLMTLVLVASPVRADQYGEVHGTTTEAPREEVTHGTVSAGIGDNLFALAAMVAGGAFALILIAKLTRRVYLLD